MKSLGARLLLSLALLVLCLAATASAHADEGAASGPSGQAPAQMSRADRLLLLDNVATFWRMGVSLGESLPEDAARRETFGLVENGRLSPAFTARVALHLMMTTPGEGKIGRVPEEYLSDEEDRQLMRIFDGVPEQYDLYIPFASLESAAQGWLGWIFDKAALPEAEYMLRSEKGLFVNREQLFGAWPQFLPLEVFAQSLSLYSEGDAWIMEGQVRNPFQEPGDIWRIAAWSPFQLSAKKVDGHWRILSLDFARFPQ